MSTDNVQLRPVFISYGDGHTPHAIPHAMIEFISQTPDRGDP